MERISSKKQQLETKKQQLETKEQQLRTDMQQLRANEQHFLEEVCFTCPLRGEDCYGNILYVRKCYLDMNHIISRHFCLESDTLKEVDRKSSRKPLIVTGNPGIGKSCFAYFLLLDLLRTGEEVFYQIRQHCFYFCHQSESWHFRILYSTWHFRILYSTGWYLCDLLENMSTFAITSMTESIIISSPKRVLCKGDLREGVPRYFLPVWLDEEMEKFLEMHKSRINQSRAQKSIVEWGNVPRTVLFPVPEGRNEEETWTTRHWYLLGCCHITSFVPDPMSSSSGRSQTVHIASVDAKLSLH